jgi:DNA-binding response OmpR family regulator
LSPITILLIDDNLVQMEIRRAVLERTGFKVLTAANADEAFCVLQSGNRASNGIGVIITDHIMPDVSGAAFVRQLREVDTVTPVIVISGLPYAEDEYAGLDVHFRYKPYAPPELIDLINSVTRSKALSATA